MPAPEARAFDAVVFDFGGVIISPITEKIERLAERNGTDVRTLLGVLMGPPHDTEDHPWHRAERGELPVAAMQGLLDPWAAAAGVTLRGDEMAVMMDSSYRFNDQVVERIGRLHHQGYRTALLTNSVVEFRPALDRDLIGKGLFDVVIDSSEVGLRKPDPRIFTATTDRLGLAPDRILYLDDFVWNVEGARLAGWRVIHVTDPTAALVELDAVLGHN